jgi:hypothetical protein
MGLLRRSKWLRLRLKWLLEVLLRLLMGLLLGLLRLLLLLPWMLRLLLLLRWGSRRRRGSRRWLLLPHAPRGLRRRLLPIRRRPAHRRRRSIRVRSGVHVAALLRCLCKAKRRYAVPVVAERKAAG